MFFEGSEKKIEVIVTPGARSLRTLGRRYWQRIVQSARAEIISQISNRDCDAYLLSESSLFVWDNRFLIITCGKTKLVDTALRFITEQGQAQVAFFSYQRKNEYQPHLQLSTINEDLLHLREIMPMQAFQLGYLDSHHHYLSHLDRDYQPGTEDVTGELLMYHIGGEAANILSRSQQSVTAIHDLLALDRLLPGFLLDEYMFKPRGYSANAVKGHHYAAIHITPQQDSSYVSFETNLDLGLEGAYIVEELLKKLQPRSWDTIGFNCTPQTPEQSFYSLVGDCEMSLDCGYSVKFSHYQDCYHNQLPIQFL